MENVRFVQLALHQGKTKKSKAAVTLVNIVFFFLNASHLSILPNPVPVVAGLIAHWLPFRATKDFVHVLDVLSRVSNKGQALGKLSGYKENLFT